MQWADITFYGYDRGTGNSIEFALQVVGFSIFSEVIVDPVFLELWMGYRLVLRSKLQLAIYRNACNPFLHKIYIE